MASTSRTPSPAARSGSDSDSVVATPLTPRTKMRQLFAIIDGDDDSSASEREREGDEENQTPSRKAKKSPLGKTSAKKSPKLTSSAAVARTNFAHSPLRAASSTLSKTSPPRLGPMGATSDEESDVEVRPRGRLAARMLANNTLATTVKTATTATVAKTAATKPTEPLADNARDRVKRMLQLAAKGNKRESEQEPRQEPEREPAQEAASTFEDTNDAEDEDDVSVPTARPRKRLTNLRTSRRSTSVSSHGGSPSRQSMREETPAMFMTPSKHTEREDSPDMFMTPSKGGDQAADGSADGAGKPGRNARFQALVARKREEARAREEAEEQKRAARQAAMAEDGDDDEPMGQLDEDDDLLMADADHDNVSDITDDEGGRKLSQKAGATRPARKASKKALEEMHRETQRMARSLQLVHEAKTRKKITKASLFERFNFKPQGAAAAAAAVPAEPAVQEAAGSSRPTSPASPHNISETGMPDDSDTPPSSPPVPDAQDESFSAPKPDAGAAATMTSVDKGKGKATETVQAPPPVQPKRQVRVRMPTSAATNLVMIDSDDDAELEIVQTSKSKLNMLFDSVPLKREQEPRSMITLRRLAQVGSPGRKSHGAAAKDGNGKPELSLGELQQSLQMRARLQAKMEREQRLEALRAKGIRIQTEEEREKEMEEVDNIVSRARQEAEELMKREREEAKKLKKGKSGEDDTNGEVDPLGWDDSEDDEGGGDYTPEDDEENMQEIELSGSDDDDDDKDDEEEETMEGALIDEEAESAEASEDGEAEAEDDTATARVPPTPTRARSSKRHGLIVSDDEDDEDEDRAPATVSATPLPPKIEAKTPGPKSTLSANTPSGLKSNLDSPAVPTSVLRSATKPFIPGMPVVVGGPAGLGLTQIFAGTMDDGDSQLMGSPAPGGFSSPSQLMPTLGNFAKPDFSSQMAAIDKASAVVDSQPTQEWLKRMQGDGSNNTQNQNQESGTSASISQMVDLNFSQSQAHGLESLLREPEMSQMSQLLGPSQDLVPEDYSPLKVRFIEHRPATKEAVVLEKGSQQLDQSDFVSPVPAAATRPRGRLFRKADMVKAVVEKEEVGEEDKEERGAAEASAFAKMREASALEKRFRKKSKAKEMVEDQAEESEDEYAGLGGADGEDSDDESLASVKDLIDDQKISSADDAKLAAFYADRERKLDEKQVEKLFRDVTTGMLRRKRGGGGGGGDYDLSDSDDGGEARRRMKRRQFARMQQALFADERVSKVAENPRNQAFMRTIEDRGSDDEMDFLFEGPPAAPASSSTPTAEVGVSQTATIPDSQPAPTMAAVASEKPGTTHPRRRRLSVTTGKKPSNLGEIRESLSNLLEDYQRNGRESSNLSIVADSEFGSDNEEDSQANKNDPLAAASASALASASNFRRPGGRTHNTQVVDRISLKRNNSSASSATTSSSTSGSGKAASSTNFGSVGPTGFRVPALLRRATTNSLASNGSSGSSRSGSGRDANFSMSTTRGPADKASSSNSGSGAGNAADSGKIKKNASKMSGIHYFARENERLAALAENDKRRQAKKVRSAEGRSRAVGGLFGAGKFE